VEHAILHLIYARFFTKVLRDLGLTSIDEPFPHYLAQGMVTKNGSAMSKSRGNVVYPDDIVKKYGADALRLFILFASPPEKEFAWAEEGIEGCFKFLNRIWMIFGENRRLFEGKVAFKKGESTEGSHQRLIKKMHQTIKKVSEDIEKRFHLNTAISSIMELYNQIKKEKEILENDEKGRSLLRKALENLILLLSPFAPHICEELWQRSGHKTLLIRSPWPSFDPELAREETVTIVIQVNGKLRDKFEAPRDLSEEEMRERSLSLSRIQAIIGKREVKKVICIPNKLVSIVL
jgi:leucyl-tRNA synthetase